MFNLVHFVSPNNPLTEDEINAFIMHMDEDKSGTIEMTEFVSFVVDALYRTPGESDAFANQSEIHAKLQALLDCCWFKYPIQRQVALADLVFKTTATEREA